MLVFDPQEVNAQLLVVVLSTLFLLFIPFMWHFSRAMTTTIIKYGPFAATIVLFAVLVLVVLVVFVVGLCVIATVLGILVDIPIIGPYIAKSMDVRLGT